MKINYNFEYLDAKSLSLDKSGDINIVFKFTEYETWVTKGDIIALAKAIGIKPEDLA